MARINTNVSALTARRHLNISYRELNQTMEHLSTGLRISRGKDDPAGLIVSERLRSEISAVGQAVSNTQRAKVVIATAEGALDEVAALLKDIQAKIVEAANEGAFSEEEIEANQLQIDSAIDSITRIANTTTFAGRKLLDGSLAYETDNVDLAAVRDLDIRAVQFGDRSTVNVNVDVLQPASQATLRFPFAALGSAVTLEIRGTDGVTTLPFASGATPAQVASGIAAVADATNVTAFVSGGDLIMQSRGFGEREYVQVRELQGNFPPSASGEMKRRGGDTVATINGSLARADGKKLTLKNPTLDLGLTVAASTYSTTFDVTGGGALFQVGPQVNTNLQVNMAVNSVHASRLGEESLGYLAEVKTGGAYSITNADPEYSTASKIVTKAIDQISVLRGRLGSFERNTLDTNMNQLGITQENLMSAESTIRDADFAYETSKLARDQILVNAGTTVLTMANQTTQSVLRLLGG